MSTADAIRIDQPLIFTLPTSHARGRLVRLGPVLDAVLAAHSYPPVVEALLAEALVLTALLGSTMKDADSQLTMQAQTGGGPVDLLVCDWQGGALRGYVKFDAERLVEAGPQPSLFALFGSGFLAITFDQPATGERYQGIVPLEGEGLSAAVAYYFEQSEQVPTLIRTNSRHGGDGHCQVGGLLLQYLPEGEDGRDRLNVRFDKDEWLHARTLAETLSPHELTDADLPLADIVWRLYHQDDARISAGVPLSRGCRCSAAHFAGVLAQFPATERADMADDDGLIQVDCAFCARLFPIPLSALGAAE